MNVGKSATRLARPATAAALMLAMLATACGGTEPDTSSTSTQRPDAAPAVLQGEAKEITVYSGRGEDLVGPVIKMFEQDSGVKVNVRYGETSELAAAILEEGDNSPADLFFAQDAGALGAVAKAGRFIRLPDELISGVPAHFRSDKSEWTGISGRARVVVFNPDKVKESDLPSDLEGFTDPRWKGRIGWAPTNASFQASITAMRILKGEDKTRAWLEAMKKNGTVSYPKNGPIVEAVGTGEIAAGFVNHYYVYEIRKEKPDLKLNIQNHFLNDGGAGSLVNAAGAGILKSSKAQKTAGDFIAYMLSRKGQEYFSSETGEYPLIAGVAAKPELPALADLKSPKIDLSKLDDLQATLALLREVGLL